MKCRKLTHKLRRFYCVVRLALRSFWNCISYRGYILLPVFERCVSSTLLIARFSYMVIHEKRMDSAFEHITTNSKIRLQALLVERLLKETSTAKVADATVNRVLWSLKVHSIFFSKVSL